MKKMIGIVVAIIMVVSLMGAVMSVSADEVELQPNAVVDLEKNGMITMDQAALVALQDSGISEDNLALTKTMLEFDDGEYTYHIEFIDKGVMKYEYSIEAFTGVILEKDQDPWEADDDAEYNGLTDEEQAFFDGTDESIAELMDECYALALEDAGVTQMDVVAYKYGVDYENGKVVEDAGFIVPGKMKYDYDIDLATKEIVEKDQDKWEAEDDAEYAGLLADNSGKATETQESEDSQAGIDEDEAKTIAVRDTKFAESEVTFTKCKLDIDDGIEIYEITFIGPDGMEYDYDILVADGSILEKDVDFDD